VFAKLWWLIEKDLRSEYRAQRVWPPMLVFGAAVALVFGIQMELLPNQKPQLVGGLLWLATFFAGMLAIDRSFASEREGSCWESLLLYPIPPTLIYLAKLLANVVALGALQCILIPLLIILSDVPLLTHPAAMLLLALLGNVGIAAAGTLLSAVVAGLRQNKNLLAILVLPMAVPVVLASAEATRLLTEGNFGPDWWRWIQLSGAFAILFVTAGILLFDFVIED